MIQLNKNSGENAPATAAINTIEKILRQDKLLKPLFFSSRVKRLGNKIATTTVPRRPWFIAVKTAGEKVYIKATKTLEYFVSEYFLAAR